MDPESCQPPPIAASPPVCVLCTWTGPSKLPLVTFPLGMAIRWPLPIWVELGSDSSIEVSVRRMLLSATDPEFPASTLKPCFTKSAFILPTHTSACSKEPAPRMKGVEVDASQSEKQCRPVLSRWASRDAPTAGSITHGLRGALRVDSASESKYDSRNTFLMNLRWREPSVTTESATICITNQRFCQRFSRRTPPRDCLSSHPAWSWSSLKRSTDSSIWSAIDLMRCGMLSGTRGFPLGTSRVKSERRSTTTTPTLSKVPWCRARSTSMRAARFASPIDVIMSQARCEVHTSQRPSVAMTRNSSPGVSFLCDTAGSGMMQAFMCASPSERDVERSPLTRITPSTLTTCPPAASMRETSDLSPGLCASDIGSADPYRNRNARESPALAQKRSVPDTSATHAVQPSRNCCALACRQNAASVSLKTSWNNARPFATSRFPFWRREATRRGMSSAANSAARAPPWPSNTPYRLLSEFPLRRGRAMTRSSF
mmetsp:Transcript_6138/g.14604  ORF Transcript_6138/g.14604 Transcript_6138/m.14604 type:complete len:486 (+) Transcript_6138:335-1792(+)